jgi:hypothetical protein
MFGLEMRSVQRAAWTGADLVTRTGPGCLFGVCLPATTRSEVLLAQHTESVCELPLEKDS